MLYVKRNNQEFGPYDERSVQAYVNAGKILKNDLACDGMKNEVNTVGYFLKRARLKTRVAHAGNLFKQIGDIGGELILPKSAFVNKKWLSDKRLLLLALVGLFPSLLISVLTILVQMHDIGIFYFISLYFSCIWGIFFYYFFKTDQTSLKVAVLVFFVSQVCVFALFDFLKITNLNPFYLLLDKSFLYDLLGYTFGVGVTEELVKAIPLYIIAARSKGPMIPQTLVFYGLVSGIAFGVYEGVCYQTQVNIQLEYAVAFLANIARLTSLPFIHAIWCAIGAYFISFAKLYPRYRVSLYFLSLAIPALFHGLYDTLCGFVVLNLIAKLLCLASVLLLMTYLKKGVDFQSKLS